MLKYEHFPTSGKEKGSSDIISAFLPDLWLSRGFWEDKPAWLIFPQHVGRACIRVFLWLLVLEIVHITDEEPKQITAKKKLLNFKSK